LKIAKKVPIQTVFKYPAAPSIFHSWHHEELDHHKIFDIWAFQRSSPKLKITRSRNALKLCSQVELTGLKNVSSNLELELAASHNAPLLRANWMFGCSNSVKTANVMLKCHILNSRLQCT
jgi:hypothetical protein